MKLKYHHFVTIGETMDLDNNIMDANITGKSDK